jgi:hypothetical protein
MYEEDLPGSIPANQAVVLGSLRAVARSPDPELRQHVLRRSNEFARFFLQIIKVFPIAAGLRASLSLRTIFEL